MKPTALLLLAALPLAGCIDPHKPLSADFGNSVNTDIALQTVNPLPRPDTVTENDGQRLGSAVDRYRADRVHQPHLPLENGKIYAPTPVEAEPASPAPK
jgi:hypothetical protein